MKRPSLMIVFATAFLVAGLIFTHGHASLGDAYLAGICLGAGATLAFSRLSGGHP